MKEFLDTSVLVSAATIRESACAVHTPAEIYATMTALPVKDPIRPKQALLFVQEVRERFTIVALMEHEDFTTMKSAASLGRGAVD